MARVSKRMKHMKEQLQSLGGAVPLEEAVATLKSLDSKLPQGVKPCKFDQSVEVAYRLGVDPRQADQIVRGTIVLPHGIGKPKRVIVFAKGENVNLAEEAGADEVGGKELADKIQGGWLEFDVAIASPDMMSVVGPLGRVLGPRGLMPAPKAGTVTQDVAKAVQEYKAGKLAFRVDPRGNVHCVVGKMSFSEQQLVDNIDALTKYIQSLRPTAAKGIYLQHLALTATMMPSISVAV